MPGARVILVDDHEGFRVSAAAFLAREGMEIVGVAGSGEEALSMVHGRRADVMLVDLMLPGMDGVDVAEELALSSDSPAVILISSHTDAAEDPRVRAAPVRGFLSKADLTCATVLALLG